MDAAKSETLREMEVARTGTTYLADVAETIRDDALKQAEAGLGPLAQPLDPGELFQRPAFVERFTYSVAKAAALAIVANDQRVEAAFLFEAEANPDIGNDVGGYIDASVHMLVVVNPPSAALESFIASLDRALVRSVRELETGPFAQRESILDVKLIGREDIAKGTGYAVLLKSIHAPALKIWQRAEA